MHRTVSISVYLALLVAPSVWAAADNSTDGGATAATRSAPNPSSGSMHLGEVSASSNTVEQKRTQFDSGVLSPRDILKSSQSVTAVTPTELRLFNPGASGVQALSIKPGIQINGYNATSGTARSTISMHGVKVSWNSEPGDLETNGITAEFDGVPINSLIQGTGWHSVEIPLGPLLSGVNVLYGPGNPRDRWCDSIGGTINFVPVQPSDHPEASVSAGYGSDQSQVYSAIASTGDHGGWSAVLATAYAHSHSFCISNFNTPTRANPVFLKLRKTFSLGSFSVGAY